MNFPKHKCGLYLTHNQHKDYYQPITEYIEEYAKGIVDSFKDASERQRAIDTNEIWEINWYPDTPIGSYHASASTLEGVLVYALEIERESELGTTAVDPTPWCNCCGPKSECTCPPRTEGSSGDVKSDCVTCDECRRIQRPTDTTPKEEKK